MIIDMRSPDKLYRYSQRQWLERSLSDGEFLLRPASAYKDLSGDTARQDDERVRIQTVSASELTLLNLGTGEQIHPIGNLTRLSEIHTDYVILCFSRRWDEKLFDEFQGTDACLVIHDVEEFRERLHSEVEAHLPEWHGMDGKVEYECRSQLGAVFSKSPQYANQAEWRFAWRPNSPLASVDQKIAKIGSIKGIAEIVPRPSDTRS